LAGLQRIIAMVISFIYPGCFEDRDYDDAVGAS